MLGLARCLGFGGTRIDAAVAAELVRAVEPLAVEAALQAGRMHMESQTERSRIAELELQQARYEAGLTERRYAACDPDNRLIAAQLEKNWEAALRRVEACQARLDAGRTPGAGDRGARPRRPCCGPVGGLERAWHEHARPSAARARLDRGHRR